MSGHGLVLGGGGITGIAWELGLIAGLAELGLDVRNADVVVGTSAGSIVGAQLSSGFDLEELYATQLVEPDSSLPRAALDKRVLLRYGAALIRSRGDLTDFGRRLGALTIRAGERGALPSLQSRYEAIGAALPQTTWPDTDLRVTAVDARTGAFRVFTRADGVPLLRVVAASCAVPGVYPAVPIDGRLYVDGGARSYANADVARGCGRIVAITPMARAARGLPTTRGQLARLGVPSTEVVPDAAALAAIGKNVLDYSARAAAAKAGRAQAASVLDRVAAVWHERLA